MNKITSELRDLIRSIKPDDYNRAQALLEIGWVEGGVRMTMKDAVEAIIASRNPEMVVRI